MNMKNIPENVRPIMVKPEEMPEELKQILFCDASNPKRCVPMETFDAVRNDLAAAAIMLDSMAIFGSVLRAHPEAAHVVENINASYHLLMVGMMEKWSVMDRKPN